MSEAVAAPVREGDILAAKYRVDRVLGAGGMGVVVAATHLQLDQRVALKFLVSASVDEQAVARFLREARAVVRLRSEHVVRVLDTGTLDNGLPYIVMELLEGRDLAQEITARGPVSVVEAADWVLQACEGIAEAHAAGIVHRDLKPANLFLTRRADQTALIKVLDFGIAKLLAVQRAPDYALTKTATLMGSPHYMSPEQIRNAKGVDERADIWALGIVLYELLTGVAPFSATTAPALLAQIVADPPTPLRPLRPDLPRGLESVIQRCLEKEPARRFADVAALAAELSRFGSEEARLSSQRVARIVRAGPLSKPRDRSLDSPLATAPTLLVVAPHAGGLRARGVVSLALGGSLLLIAAAWFHERSRGASPKTVASTAAVPGAPVVAVAPQVNVPQVNAPLVTPLPASAWVEAPPWSTGVHDSAAPLPAPAVRSRPSVPVVSHRAHEPPSAAPAAAPAPAPAPGALEDRK